MDETEHREEEVALQDPRAAREGGMRKGRVPASGLLHRASARVLEYWKRRSHRPQTGRALTLMELEVKRIEDQRALEKDLAERFDEPGLGERQTGFPYVAFTVYLLLGIVVVGIPVAIALRKTNSATVLSEPQRPAEAVLPIDEQRVTSDTAAQVADSFLQALTTEERLALVRNPEAVQLSRYPEEVRAHPIAFADLRPMGIASANGEARFHRFGVRMQEGGMRLLCVVETNRGPLVDYPAFARYGSAAWDELLEGAAAEEIRVMAKASTYYQYGFIDEEKWVSFELSSPDWPGSLMGYARRESPTAGTLAQIVKKTRQRVTLKIRREGESNRHRQVVIEKVLASGWVRTEGDIESKWMVRRRGL